MGVKMQCARLQISSSQKDSHALAQKKAVESLKDLAEKNGALQARMLKTSGGFHTKLMTPAQKKLEAALTELLPNMKPLEKAVYCNVNAKLMPRGTDPSEIVPLL